MLFLLLQIKAGLECIVNLRVPWLLFIFFVSFVLKVTSDVAVCIVGMSHSHLLLS